MLSSGILDFAIGMIFTFFAVSLAAGAATEAVASVLKWRSHTLFKGVKDLLNDRNFKALAAEIYSHGLINPRGDGSVPDRWQRWLKGPAYIQPDQFAAAFLDIINGVAAGPAGAAAGGAAPQRNSVVQLNQAVNDKVKNNPQINAMLHGIIQRAEGDEEEIRKELAAWFDNAMDRVSGAYKRWAQLSSFILAFLIATLLNISAIDVAKSLWKQPIDTKAISATTAQTPLLETLNNLDKLEPLPIGWPVDAPRETEPVGAPPETKAVSPSPGEKIGLRSFFTRPPADWDWTRIGGWIITAFATVFGAPFWFDALQKVIRLKGSGPSPKEKVDDKGAAA